MSRLERVNKVIITTSTTKKVACDFLIFFFLVFDSVFRVFGQNAQQSFNVGEVYNYTLLLALG